MLSATSQTHPRSYPDITASSSFKLLTLRSLHLLLDPGLRQRVLAKGEGAWGVLLDLVCDVDHLGGG